jgi:hypothetical protein
MNWKQCAAAVCVSAVAACAPPTPDRAEIGLPPVQYQGKVRDHIKTTFFDPCSLRDVELSEPVPVSMVFDGSNLVPYSGWMVCLKANGKNRLGGYTGLQITGILFQGGVITTTTPSAPASMTLSQVHQHCRNARWSQFSV